MLKGWQIAGIGNRVRAEIEPDDSAKHDISMY